MINTIYTQIQLKEQISFDELFKQNSEKIPTKQELGALLRALENEHKVFQYSGNYYDLSKYENIEGYVQWNLTGFCWLSEKNEMNSWGITFDPNDNLLSIYNKREAFFGHFIQGKKITLEDKEFVYVTSGTPSQEVNLIAHYHKVRNEWTVINSGNTFSFRLLENKEGNHEFEHGTVALFKSQDNQLKSYRFIENLGNLQDYGMESKIIRLLSEIKEAPESNFAIQHNNLPLLNKPFYTIDSLYTKDIDDAIWIEKNSHNNCYKLYVAIADVSSFVLPNDIQDQHAREACTSFYLPHETIHMLDRKLAEDFCSLNPGVKKQSMVCEMDFDQSGILLNKQFYQAEILSHARLTYEDVDKMIENINPQDSLYLQNGHVEKLLSYDANQDVLNSLKLLFEFSQTQNRQDERDYWVLESTEYMLNEQGKIDHLYEKEESAPSQKMVESAMLAANISAAQFIFEKYPQFGMFRNQYKPEDNTFPKPAFYDFNNQGHWGLKTEFYTHFTSPIRRYCDLLVHRLIKSIVCENEKIYSNEQLEEFAKQINLQQYKAKQFNIKSKNLLVPQYFEYLLNNNLFDERLKIVDFAENGVVCRNKQLLELFIPSFKLERDIAKSIKEMLPVEGEELSIEEKDKAIKKLNKEWLIFTKISNFVWTDDRKNAFYQMLRKKHTPKPNTNI